MYKCILVIDDDETTNLISKVIIDSSKKFENVIFKKDAFYALEYLKNYDSQNFIIPNLILLDINMPIMNGWKFLEEYKKLPEALKIQIKIVVFTASENILDIQKAQSIKEIDDSVNKPFSITKLNKIIEKHLG